MKSKRNIHLLLVKSILFLSFCSTGIFYPLQAQTTYFVSLNGNDKNNGSEKAPFKSIKAAQDKAREQKGEVTIYLRSGEYRLDKTLIFTPQDGNKDKRLTLSSYPGEQAVICGGVQLKLKWQPYKNGIMQAKVTPKISIDMLTDNGKISHMARYPNFDSLAVRFNGTSADATSPDRVKTWKNPSGGYLHAMHVSDWGDFHYRITGNDEKGILKLEGGWQNNRPYGLSPDNRMVENIFEELDAPGEWYYDTNEAILYYYPLHNEDIANSVFEVAQLKHLVEFKGTEQEPVKNITIKSIEFTQTARTFMEKYEPLLRSDWTIYRGGAIVFEGTESCNLNGCYLHNLGGNAVFFSNYNRNSGISGSYITQIGASAICFVGDTNAVRSSSFNYHSFIPLEQMDREPGPKTNNYPANCLVYDNLIHTIGLFEKQITGVELSMCKFITVSHNSIYDVPRAGINVSEGTWGGHIIEYNDVFETVKETGDHGSFNSWGRDRFWHPNRDEMNRITAKERSLILADATSTTIIRNNRFRCDRGWDIDLDDGSGNYHIYNNLCLNGGIKLREGFFRVVENNILVNNTFHPHVWFENSGDIFARNIVMETYQPINLAGWGAMVDYNIFTDAIALADAQNRGTDRHSIIYPVEFLDPVSGDYRVKNTASSVFRLGFQNFDMDCFGVVSPWLKHLAKIPRLTLPIIKASDTFSDVVEWQDSISAIKPEKQIIEAEIAKLVGGASKVTDKSASGGQLVNLAKPGQELNFENLPEASKLAIRYTSVNVGTISVLVNNQQTVKVNVHSSGAVTGSFLYAMIDIVIPKGAKLDIRFEPSDIALNVDYIIIGNGDLGLTPDIWNLPQLKVTDGPYKSDWKEISRIYTVPAWWREAKFGAWAHWDPQSMPEQGDWYARGMYMEENSQYNYHVSHFGHPSEYGYKDICNNWVIDRWDPEALIDLYVEMGARYFMAMGVHHDNFDCWNSAYQPWNAVRIGPKTDIVGTWEKIARQHSLRFGIGFHNTPGRTWGQFMTVRYTSDKKGAKQGVSYDALQTIADGKGKWWEGMDPVDLYGPVHDIKNPLQSPFANQFMWRVDDAITKYHPDMIYFDEHAGDSQVDLGVNMGLGFLAPSLIVNYYNKSLQWNHGRMDVVINLKGVGGHYNSFENNPQLIPFVDRALVKSTEAIIEPEIMAYPFQTETSIADWHYRTGQKYMDAKKIIELLMQNVSRNGTMLLNITQHGRGNLDPELIQICKDVGAWLKINGEAVYGSRPFEACGDNTVSYTRNNGNVYATVFNWNDSTILLNALHLGGSTLGKVTGVELIGSNGTIRFIQDEKGLTVVPEESLLPLSGIFDHSLAQKCRVLRITHDKGWINDDDLDAVAPGWFRYCNLGTGDFNNDLTISETPGDVWSCSFTGNNIAVISPIEAGAGKIEIQIDGKSLTIVDLSNTGERKPQQVVYEETGLPAGKHIIKIINRGSGKVAVDALIIK